MTSKVTVKIYKDGKQYIPKFLDCILHVLNDNTNNLKAPVEFVLEGNSLTLKKIDSAEKSHNISFIHHSIVCPLAGLAQSPLNVTGVKNSKIVVAVSIILESADNHVLFTKRADHMRTFPGGWVPPGGHLEKGETLIDCGLRELFEETGINAASFSTSIHPLCLWENVAPISLAFGTPKRHSVVVYYHVKCEKSYKEIEEMMDINPKEIQAYAWLAPQAIVNLFQDVETGNYVQKQVVLEGDKYVEVELNYLNMFSRKAWTSGYIFSGVQCSLTEWYNDYKSRRVVNKL